jgi:Ca-activated chloride channel family protein
MSWGHAIFLWLIPAFAVLAAGRWWWGRRVLLACRAIGAGVPHLNAGVARRRSRLRTGLLWSGLILTTLALASPRWGASDTLRRNKGCDLLVVVDCSRSMLATDLYPNRIEVARHKAIDFLRIAPETRMALMPFAAIATLRCPLTGDHDALAEMLKDCSPELFPADQGYQGTAIGEAIRQGLAVLGKQVERGQAVLVLSDGDDDDTEAVAAATKAAKDAGVPVYGLFLGDPERTAELDIDGKKQVMKSSRKTLDDLARETGGASVTAGLDDSDVRMIHEHLQAHVQQSEWQESRRVVASERYHWLLLPAMALVMLGMFMPTRRRL